MNSPCVVKRGVAWHAWGAITQRALHAQLVRDKVLGVGPSCMFASCGHFFELDTYTLSGAYMAKFVGKDGTVNTCVTMTLEYMLAI